MGSAEAQQTDEPCVNKFLSFENEKCYLSAPHLGDLANSS